jgi:hypothetical protein
MTGEEKEKEKEEKNCHMLITSLLNEGAVIKIRFGIKKIINRHPGGPSCPQGCRFFRFFSGKKPQKCLELPEMARKLIVKFFKCFAPPPLPFTCASGIFFMLLSRDIT